MRLRRSNLSRPGYTRRRYGRGFRYLDQQGRAIADPRTIGRIRALAIPPAWRDVWISPDPRGHIQATGVDGCVFLDFPGKAGVVHATTVDDGEVCAVLRDLKRRRRNARRLFAYWDRSVRRWQEVRAETINEYLRTISGERMTAKDFRTWHGTVRAAEELAKVGPQPTDAKRRKAVSHAMREVADLLGNTPAVARSSYVDPRVLDRYARGEVVEGGGEREVRELLREE